MEQIQTRARLSLSGSDEGKGLGSSGFLFWISALWIFLIFCGWDVFQWLSNIHSHYGTFAVTSSVFSEQNAWLPLAYRVSQGNLFPILPSIDPHASGFSFYPYLSLWFQGLMIAIFGIQGAYFISHTIFPLSCFFLLYAIFRKSLSGLWSVSLTFLALICFAPLPFRSFLFGLFNQGWQDPITSLQPLEIAHFPFPALSLPCFLAAFLLTIQKKRLTVFRLTGLTVAWALQSQIYLLNAVVGLAFWFSTFPVRLKRQGEKETWGKFLFQAWVAAVVLLPSIWGFWQLNQGEGLNLFNLDIVTAKDGLAVSSFYFIAYFIVPCATTYLAYALFRFDQYELFYRFWPVFVLLATELAISMANLVLGFSLDPSLAFSRLGIFFLHFYYLVPLIYFFSSKLPILRLRNEPKFFRGLRFSLGWWVNGASRVYLPLLMISVSAFAFFSMKRSFEHRKSIEEPRLAQAWKKFDLLSKDGKVKEGLVSEDPVVNLLIPVASNMSTLWVSRFANQISFQEGAERLALYAHLFGWNKDQFIQFMLPGTLQNLEKRQESKVANKDTLIELGKDSLFTSGIGYWLTMHKARLNSQGDYIATIKKVFDELDVKAALKKFGIKKILAEPETKLLASVRLISESNLGKLYEVVEE